jgi:hypothetical protein
MPKERKAFRQEGRRCASRAEPEQRGILAMTKTLEVITEAIRNPKHPFRKVDNQPKKPLKHRYERRKIKEYLHLGGALASEETTLSTGMGPMIGSLTSSAASDARA